MPTDPTPAPAEMFAMTFAGAFGAFTACLMCGAPLADAHADCARYAAERDEARTTATEGSTS